MNAHRSLHRTDITKHSPAEIALMIASEFSRASSRCHHRENVLNCYARAQELLGILETLSLSDTDSALLEALYRQCASKELILESRLIPEVVKEIGSYLADAFQHIATVLSIEAAHYHA